VIFGLNLFGFLGLIFGPLLLALFLLLVRIYYDEFVHEEETIEAAKILEKEAENVKSENVQ
jgi:predicted PurR-regulated permease PerM